MEIARERFLDQSREYHVSLSLRSRTAEMHSVLSALTNDERDAVNAAMVRALDEIETILGRHIPVRRD